jgi:outer membrane protein W
MIVMGTQGDFFLQRTNQLFTRCSIKKEVAMNKRIGVYLALLLILPIAALAQNFAVDKGSILIDGSAGFSSSGGDLNEVNGEKSTEIMVNPFIGYFIVPNLGVGLEGIFAKESQGDYSVSAFGVGPRVAYFLGNASSKTFPFLGAGVFLVKGKAETGDPGVTAEETQFNISVSAGITAMVAKNVGITGKVYYTLESNKPKDADEAIKGNIIGVALGISSFIF